MTSGTAALRTRYVTLMVGATDDTRCAQVILNFQGSPGCPDGLQEITDRAIARAIAAQGWQATRTANAYRVTYPAGIGVFGELELQVLEDQIADALRAEHFHVEIH